MTPGSRHAKACEPTSIEAVSPAAAEDEELLAVVGRVLGLDVDGPGRRRQALGQAGVGVDRVGVGLDDVDGPAAGGAPVEPGARAQDVDLLAGVVVGDPRPGRRQRMRGRR